MIGKTEIVAKSLEGRIIQTFSFVSQIRLSESEYLEADQPLVSILKDAGALSLGNFLVSWLCCLCYSRLKYRVTQKDVYP